MKTRTFFFLLLAASSLTVACSKEKEEDHHEDEVEVHIVNPQANTEFALGDTVFMTINASTTGQFHGYEIELVNLSDSSDQLFYAGKHEHGSSLEIDTFWVNNVSVHSDVEMRVNISTGHDGSKESRTVHIHCHPM